MLKKKYDLAIINRSFWPQSEILGEAKLRLAERVAEDGRACVIAQAKIDVKGEALRQNRANKVKFYVAKSRSDSSSGLVRRIFDALLFGPYVFLTLCRARPKHIYISTNPPVVVPFLVYLYCKLFHADYTYHLQDIHPEITNLVLPMNRLLFRFLRRLDNTTLRNAKNLITLSNDMASCLRRISGTKAKIHIVDNPGFETTVGSVEKRKTNDLVFCGNAGRVQQIPNLLKGIETYLKRGGRLNFTFIGGGVYASQIKTLSEKQSQVAYLGYLKPSIANNIVSEHRWAILPIQDDVAQFAFPSKSSSYLASGCKILGICGPETSVAKWIEALGVGAHVHADPEAIARTLGQIELSPAEREPTEFRSKPKTQTIQTFVEDIEKILASPKLS
ncbi:glycosyltransferase [Pseudidiomarina sp.]|uniref:glycosyltransferase n=1 Tax=Pseudidiomarina sp. TaxID=2081707 RepID=UPI003A96C8E3